MALAPGTSLASNIVTDEQAKALTAGSTFGTTVVTELSNLARYMGWVLGTTPKDIVGLIIGTPLNAVHTLIAGILNQKVQTILERRKVQVTQAVSPSLGLPLLRAAYDESRPELQDMWAALIAAAMDPERSGRVRLSFVEALKRFDPLDALVLKARFSIGNTEVRPNHVEYLSKQIGCSAQDTILSAQNLIVLKCAVNQESGPFVRFHLTHFGEGLLRACSD